ncbi:MAG: hypothetical protein AAB967_01940, partial [Patescibacteria group bacterium]
MKRFIQPKIFALGVALVAVVLLGIRLAGAAPPSGSTPGGPDGAINAVYNPVDSSFNVGIGGTADSASKLLVVPSGANTNAFEVRSDDTVTPIFTVQKSGEIVVGTPSANASTTLNGNLVVTGTISGTFVGAVEPRYITSGVFDCNPCSSGGSFAFPSKLGVNTDSQANIPLAVEFYVDGAMQAGTSTFTGQILAPSGSQSAPAYSFSSTPSAGIYAGASANSLSLVSNAAEILRVRKPSPVSPKEIYAPDSRVWIEHAGSLGQPALEIKLDGQGGGFYIPVGGGFAIMSHEAVGDVPRDRIRITPDGLVGVNTITPTHSLHVEGAFRLQPTSTIPVLAEGVIYYDS